MLMSKWQTTGHAEIICTFKSGLSLAPDISIWLNFSLFQKKSEKQNQNKTL